MQAALLLLLLGQLSVASVSATGTALRGLANVLVKEESTSSSCSGGVGAECSCELPSVDGVDFDYVCTDASLVRECLSE